MILPAPTSGVMKLLRYRGLVPIGRTNYRIRRLRLSRHLLGQAARHPSPRIIRTLGMNSLLASDSPMVGGVLGTVVSSALAFIWARVRNAAVRWGAAIFSPLVVACALWEVFLRTRPDPSEYSSWALFYVGPWCIAGVVGSATVMLTFRRYALGIKFLGFHDPIFRTFVFGWVVPLFATMMIYISVMRSQQGWGGFGLFRLFLPFFFVIGVSNLWIFCLRNRSGKSVFLWGLLLPISAFGILFLI
jgi:hypothetical protein